jgi:hypothetical protein
MNSYPTNDQLRRIAMEARDKAAMTESGKTYGKRFLVIVDGEKHERQTVPALVKLLTGCVANWGAISPFRNMNGQATIDLDA